MLGNAEEIVFFTLQRKLVFLIAQKGAGVLDSAERGWYS
jgi:hypothetical protein